MEESRALSKLNEAADLLLLLEDVLNPSSVERLSQGSWSGLRITLKNARSMLQESQVSLSKEFVSRARNSQTLGSGANTSNSTSLNGNAANSNATVTTPIQVPADGANSNGLINAANAGFDKSNLDPSRVQITRRDLKASLEKFIETR